MLIQKYDEETFEEKTLEVPVPIELIYAIRTGIQDATDDFINLYNVMAGEDEKSIILCAAQVDTTVEFNSPAKWMGKYKITIEKLD